MDSTSIGKALHGERVNAGFRQKEVSEGLHCSIASISRWETGRHQITVDDFIRLCKFYGSNPSEVLAKAL